MIRVSCVITDPLALKGHNAEAPMCPMATPLNTHSEYRLALGGDWQTDNFKVAIEVVRGWNLNLSAAGFNSIKYFLILESAK